MRQENSVMHGLLQRVPWRMFDGLVDAHHADRGVRRLSTKSQFVAMLFGQLAGAASLREIETALASHCGRLYHLGARTVARATLADANAKRPVAVFTGVLAALMAQAQRRVRGELADVVRLLDSTSIRLAGLGCEWARFSSGVCGAKAHVVFDPDAVQPLYLSVTPAKVNDITAAKAMPIEAGATYVFDLGYYDYSWWAGLDAAGCRIVTRFRINTPLREAKPREVAADGNVLSDRIGLLPERLSATRQNPFQARVREVRVKIASGKVLRLLSNDLEAPAEEIADLYRRRSRACRPGPFRRPSRGSCRGRQIELFFRWIKQALKIKHLFGVSENAVRIQIAVALIAFILLRLAHQATAIVGSLLAFCRLIRVNLMHRRRLDRLLQPAPSVPDDTRQLRIAFA
jgi:Domain of unknown function (DUF4372)/Transposase DDE domain